MELRQLRYVLTVAETGSFTAAAEVLYVSQPSVSQGIGALERELGVRLFHRVGRGVVLSAAGEAVLEPARRALREVDAARTAAGAVVGLLAGRLDLVSLPTLASEPLPRLVGAFRRAHPAVRVEVLEPDDDRDAVDAIVTGRVELGLLELPSGHGELFEEVLFVQRIVAVFPPGTPRRRRPLPPADLGDVDLITTPAGSSTRRIAERAVRPSGRSLRIAVETGQREAILPLVLAGAGAALLPEPLAAEAAAAGAVVLRLAPSPERTVGLVRRAGPLSPAGEAFAAIARDLSA
ncbi:MAG TPA: LysR family transcriptional regulator [Actinomycetota bacterium]|nr:LysR family transcriptional regulator [Actinomycetota bacterium]